MQDCKPEDKVRRLFNQAVFEMIYIDEDEETHERSIRVDYNQPFDDLLSRLVPAHVHHELQKKQTAHREDPTDGDPLASGVPEGQSSHTTTLVDLTGQLSNLCPAAERMLAKKSSQVSRTVASSRPSVHRQKHVRLSDAQKAELVQRHRDGAFKKELARAYGIHVETVRAIIRRAASAT